MAVLVRSTGHMRPAVEALLRLGFTFERVPEAGKLKRNGQLVRLKWGAEERRLRLFIYKITGGGRNTQERRIEITTTYQKGLEPALGYRDVVLGYDPDEQIYVGVDARRIDHGGPTGNASSFINPEGLEKATKTKLTMLRRPSQIFGVEHQAYFKRDRLAEYLINAADIHRGQYDRQGPFSRNTAVTPNPSFLVEDQAAGGEELLLAGPASRKKRERLSREIVKAFEEDNTARLKDLRITQDQFFNLNKIRQEVGLKGEEYVFKSEVRRLKRAGKAGLAAKISWVAQTRPFEGYDILSFETDGRRRYIEVKATKGSNKIFPITDNEWRFAAQMGDQYFIYRVTKIDDDPRVKTFQNPVQQEQAGVLTRDALAWTLAYQ